VSLAGVFCRSRAGPDVTCLRAAGVQVGRVPWGADRPMLPTDGFRIGCSVVGQGGIFGDRIRVGCRLPLGRPALPKADPPRQSAVGWARSFLPAPVE